MDSFFSRHADKPIRKLSKMFGAVLVTGARQVGKTTLLQKTTGQRGYVTLDDKIQLVNAVNQSKTFFKDNPPPVFVDEVQYAPNLFPEIKIILDKEKKKGLFYLSGSQQFEMMKNVSESLAGRLGILNLPGLSLLELYGLSFNEPFLSTDDYFASRAKKKRIFLMMMPGKSSIAVAFRSYAPMPTLTGDCSMRHTSKHTLNVMSVIYPMWAMKLNLCSL